MNTIYMPSGKAGEYSPLALNLYKGCDHGCAYCYVPKQTKAYQANYNHANVMPRDGIITQLEKDARKLKYSDKQVQLSFTGDPYCHADVEYQLTRKALQILLNNSIPVSILTKGGKRALRDMDLFLKFGNNIKIGTSLTYDNKEQTKLKETGTAMPEERIEMLEELHKNRITTWVSIEPVIYPEQSLNLVKMSLPFTTHYKIGKLNHYKEWEDKINWLGFMKDVVGILRANNKSFYVKKDLREFNDGSVKLTIEQSNPYSLFLCNTFPKLELFEESLK